MTQSLKTLHKQLASIQKRLSLAHEALKKPEAALSKYENLGVWEESPPSDQTYYEDEIWRAHTERNEKYLECADLRDQELTIQLSILSIDLEVKAMKMDEYEAAFDAGPWC